MHSHLRGRLWRQYGEDGVHHEIFKQLSVHYLSQEFPNDTVAASPCTNQALLMPAPM